MRILHIISSLKLGGGEQALCNLLKKLITQSNEHNVAYFHSGPHVQTLKNLNIPIYQINGVLNRYDPIALLRLRRLIRKIRPDLIHTALWSANIIGRLLAHQFNIPVISDLHGNCRQEGRFRNFLDRLTAHIPYATIAVSGGVKNDYVEHIIEKIKDPLKKGSARKSLVTIKNGIDPEYLRRKALENPLTRSQLGIEENAFVIGSVGRFEAIKSYDILIKAFASLYKRNFCKQKPLVLCLVGDGNQKQHLQDLALSEGIAYSTIFTGARNDPYRFYPIFNCFALSSQSEGLSIALLEALSFGLPIITTNNSPTHEVITHGAHGLLVPPNNISLLESALENIYKKETLTNSMKQSNTHLVENFYHINHVAKRYLHIYNTRRQSSD